MSSRRRRILTSTLNRAMFDSHLHLHIRICTFSSGVTGDSLAYKRKIQEEMYSMYIRTLGKCAPLSRRRGITI